MKLVAALLFGLFLLLGVQRTPEAQVGEAALFVGSAVASGLVVGGCVHATGMAKPDMPAPEPEPQYSAP